MIDPDHAITSDKSIDAESLTKSTSGQLIKYAPVSAKPLIGHDAPTLKDFMNGKRTRNTKSLASIKKKKITDGSSSAIATPTLDVSSMTANLIQSTQVFFSRSQ
ncbi:hypothetical protein GQ55_2G171400 [Panicum hallii var. hallii]|uniref:Uncharacterized protein n=1 Tax=Panicum hallii var. hallii TaxID=1504633 RepID=A0A2T7EQ38_9POAL|nr:hypothetical protein GQ55_2G171400 [Panicum hallii var. hallii]